MDVAISQTFQSSFSAASVFTCIKAQSNGKWATSPSF